MPADLTIVIEGTPIPVRLGDNTELASERAAAAAESAAEAGVSASVALAASAYTAVPTDVASYSALSTPHPVSNYRPGPLGYSPFVGYIVTFVSADIDPFNAFRLARVFQSAESTMPLIRKVRVEVKTLSSSAQLADVMAYGEARVNPGAETTDLVIPLRDAVTGELLAAPIESGDLDTQVAFVVKAYDEDGELTAIADLLGDLDGLTLVDTFYINAGAGALSNYAGDPGLAIEPVLLTDPAVTVEMVASVPLSTDLGVERLSRPGAYEPILAPIVPVMAGQQCNIHYAGLVSAADGVSNKTVVVECSKGLPLDELWRLNGSADIAAEPFAIEIREPGNNALLGRAEARLECVLANAAGGAARRIMCGPGDSTTYQSVWIKRMMQLSAANASGVQLTLVGTHEAWVVDVTGKAVEGDVYTNGGNSYTVLYGLDGDEVARANSIALSNAGALGATGTLTKFSGNAGSSATLNFTNGTLVKHEGVGGKTTQFWYQPPAGQVAENPFINGGGGANKFDASFYGTNTSQAAPDIAVSHLGINDVFSALTDAEAHGRMDGFLDRQDRMFGLISDASVGSLREWNASMTLIPVIPIFPAGHQDAFGDNYSAGGNIQHRARYLRNIAIAAWRIKEHYQNREDDGVFLLGWNATLNKDHHYPAFSTYGTQVDPTAAMFPIWRQLNAVHPASHGYDLMGYALWQLINVLVARGLA
jgi:hypothetical protein